MADVTVYGQDGHSFVAGLETGSLSIDGHLDNVATAGGQDATSDAALQASAASVITVGENGLVLGNRVFMIEARETNYAVSSPVADKVSFSASWQSEGQVDHGVSLRDLTATSATGQGTNVDNTASTPGGAAASLHVTSNTRNGTTIVKVQHSVDNSVWVDLITFTTVTASTTTAQKAAVTGTVNRHLRAQYTIAGSTGSVTFAVAAARR